MSLDFATDSFSQLASHNLGLSLAPLLPWPVLAVLGILALLLCAWGFWRRARGTFWRVAVFFALALALLNPSWEQEQRAPLPNTVLLIKDQSASMRLGQRQELMRAAESTLRNALAKIPNNQLRTIEVSGSERTELLAAIRAGLSDGSNPRMGAVFILSDGQDHSPPALSMVDNWPANMPPIHSIILGKENELDRSLSLEGSQSFARVGESVKLRLRVTDSDENALMRLLGKEVELSISQHQAPPQILMARTGEEIEITLPIKHAGSNTLSVEVSERAGELTRINNRAALIIEGVRDRLRVLLVSGEPYPGLRSWRNFLKADPAVDLVHFTILRPPEKQDATPLNELSLIQFPTRELFEEKIDDFDLIIFDRFRTAGVVPHSYLENIAKSVRDRGGAFLDVSGTSFAGTDSLAFTPLGSILPVSPTGNISLQSFIPATTNIGQRHPITAGLLQNQSLRPWQRAMDGTIKKEQTKAAALMQTPNQQPLLVVDEVGKGRVAMMLSDQIWLWSGQEDAAPRQELLRRIAHWLMREPSLEAEALRLQQEGDALQAERQSLRLDRASPTITLINPEGEREALTLATTEDKPGLARGFKSQPMPGLWQAEDGDLRAFAAVGGLNAPEQQQLVASAAPLSAIRKISGGGLIWFAAATEKINLRATQPLAVQRGGSVDRAASWLGVQENGGYRLIGRQSRPLWPAGWILFLMLIPLALCWWRESR